MAYKLAEEDKLCGVIYPTYEGFSPIPKATCEMLESKCEQTIIVKCKDNQSEEDKKPESQSGSVSASASESTSVPESISESNSTSESQASTSESTSESTSTGSTSTSESTTQSESTSVSTTLSTSESTSVSPSESSSTENSNTPEEAPKEEPEEDEETKSLKNDIANIKNIVSIGNLTHDAVLGYTYSGIVRLGDAELELKKFIEKEKGKYPGYNISYETIPSKNSPTSPNDEGEEYLWSIKFTVNKEGKSFEDTVYVPYTISETDHL